MGTGLWIAGIVILCIGCYAYIRIRKGRSIKGYAVIINEDGIPLKPVAVPDIPALPATDIVVMVRVAIFYKNMIYLKERPATDFYEPGRWDLPIEFYYQIEGPLKEFVKGKLLYEYGLKKETKVHYSIRYKYHDERISRDIYFYYIRLNNEKDQHLKGGKFWLMKQIEDNVNKGALSTLFEHELEYYKSIISTWEEFHSSEKKNESPLEQN